jgi:hypothetical protein
MNMKMNMKKGVVCVLVVGICFMGLSLPVGAETLQGRLEHLGPKGISPAPYILVTLKSSQTGKYQKPVQTETNGMYYFDDIAPGDYSLEIWPQGPSGKALRFAVSVREQKPTFIESILIHWLKFEEPPRGSIFRRGDTIDVGGSHSLPPYARIWIVMKDRRQNFWLHNTPVELEKDGTWGCDNVSLAANMTRIQAVLVNEEIHRRFRQFMVKQQPEVFKELPPEARILASRDIIVK